MKLSRDYFDFIDKLDQCHSACNFDSLSRRISVQNCPPKHWPFALLALSPRERCGMLTVETIGRIRRAPSVGS
jgi:hypothetical protein